MAEQSSQYAKLHFASDGNASVFPRLALVALDDTRWLSHPAQKACWLAFAGSKAAISEDPILSELEVTHPEGPLLDHATGKEIKLQGEVRGTSAKRFETVFRIFSDQSHPTLPHLAYCAKGRWITPPRLGQHRETKGHYRRDEGRSSIGSTTDQTAPGKKPAQSTLSVPSAFISRLPKARADAATAKQKFKLYGGALKTFDMDYDPVRHVVNDHNFPRRTASDIANAILRQSSPFSAITLRAQHGEGLSLTLAEVAVSLARRPDVLGFWVIGDPKRTDQLLEELPSFLRERRFTDQSVEGLSKKKLVFIIDDLSEVDDTARLQDAQRFHEDLEAFADEHIGVRASVVYGVFGSFPSIVDGQEINLRLSDRDQQACFDKMVEGDPPVLLDGPEGFQRIVTENPVSRSYDNDVQAFIDYLLEFGRRTKNADDNWLSRTACLSGWEARIVESTAVSGLLGLSLQANVALQLAAWDEEVEGVSEVEQIARASDLLTVVEDEWCGLSLTSPRRAQSLLRRLGKNDIENLSQKLFFLFDTALTCYVDKDPGSDDSLEYARHILQRLNKNELYVLSNKRRVSRFILERSLERIEELSEEFEPTTAARWAGSICPLFPAGTTVHTTADQLERSLSDLTLTLVKAALSKLNEKTNPPPEMALSLFKALRRLASSSLTRRQAEPLLEQAAGWLTEDGLARFVDAIVANRGRKLEYRLNELFLASTKLKRECAVALRLRPTEAWFDAFEEKMRSLELNLDAGAWLERARYASTLRDRALYLEVAEASAVYKHRSQATWLKAIEHERRKRHGK